MTKYLISFPSEAMDVDEEDLPGVADAAHAVIRQAMDAGVYVFGGGIDEGVEPVMVAGDGTVTNDTYAGTTGIRGGFTILELPSPDEAHAWAARIAVACRCSQEVRAFQFDPLA